MNGRSDLRMQTGIGEPVPCNERDPDLVELADIAGVRAPSSYSPSSELDVPRPIPFIENKIYDHKRISDLLSLSISQNHHANGGPVSKLLEAVVGSLIGESKQQRSVIAVSSGTAALHMACGMHAASSSNPGFQWVTSAFNFFSARVGPLARTKVLDCNPKGGFDIDALRALPLDSYDGVIYTNVFAQYTDWDEVAEFCANHDKRLVIDNATGLLDRPRTANEPGGPIEIISAHQTKPWGVGEGGFIICDAGDEPVLRGLANFGAPLAHDAAFAASNYKISDLSAAAIIDRLERMPGWAYLYTEQEKRLSRLMQEAGIGVVPFTGSTTPLSPRAHTPLLCPTPVDTAGSAGPVTLRKYYRPLASPTPTPNADDLFARIFSLSNAPEMRFASDEAIMAQVREMTRRTIFGRGII